MNENLAYKDEPYQEPWREELIAGKLVAMAPARTVHNHVKGNIHGLFWGYLKDKTCQVLPDGEAVFLTETDYYYPDSMIVCDPDKIKWDGVHGAPDLAVEVLSPSTAKFDKGRKKDVYEACGVREYWLVDPANKSVEQYILTGGRFILNEVYTLYPNYMLEAMKPEERAAVVTEFKCSLYDDLIIQLEDVFYRVP